MALTAEEENKLVGLLEKLEWPVSPKVFRALLARTVSVPIELAVLDQENQVLTFPRKDQDYEGEHLPGTVMRDNDSVGTALNRLLASEVVGTRISRPKYIDWIEIPKGTGPGENPHRHEISLIHVTRLLEPYRGENGKFSPLHQLPDNILPHHRVIAKKVAAYLNR